MLRTLLVAATLLAPPAAGAQTVFDRMTGVFGSLEGHGTCRTNPHTITFSADRTRLRATWEVPTRTYRDRFETSAEYVVVAHDDTGITVRLEDEPRMTADGRPVVWIARPITRPAGYCWGRTDWPPGRCENVRIRCGAPALS